MKRRSMMALVWLWLCGGVLLWGARPLWAQEPTATPDAAGNIYIIVQPNDSLWAVAARAGLTLNELLTLNNLPETAVIQPGQRLLVGFGPPPVTPTLIPSPTPTRLPPTPRVTPSPPRTAICLVAFVDGNRDGRFQPGEELQSGVVFTVFDDTAVVVNYITTGSEPYCRENLPAGDYHITRSINPQEVLTNEGDLSVTLKLGDVAYLEFGSYVPPVAGVETAVPPAILPIISPTATQPTARPTADPRLPTLLLAVGLVVVSIGVGVVCLLIWKQLRRT